MSNQGQAQAVQSAGGSFAVPSPQELAQRLSHPSIRAPLAIALTDERGQVQWVNPAFSRQTGYRVEEVIGRDRLSLFRGPVAHSGEIERIREAMAAGQTIETEFQTRTRAGRPYWASCIITPTLNDGRPESFVFAEEDVTQRRRSDDAARQAIHRAEALADSLRNEQELLASVLSTIPHMVFWKDTENRYLGCNDAYLRLRGLGSATELVGRQEHELATAGDLTATIQALEESVAATGQAAIDQALRVEDGNGVQRALMFSVLPRHGANGAPDGVIGVGADVSRAQELERQLAQANRLEAIGQLAAGLAHEINTPVQYVSDNVLFLTDSVNDMLGLLQSLATIARTAEQPPSEAAMHAALQQLRELVDGLDLEFLSHEVPGALEQTLEGVGRVGEIVRAMKDFSHPGQGKADTDLNRAVQSTVQVSRSEWKYIAELDLDLDPAVGLVPCYEGEIKQVILNLIVNAAHAVADRHQEDGHLGKIGVATRRHDTEVSISIQDDGCGMDEATRLRIFDPFFTTKEVGKGTGQGLSMAHNCVVGKHAGSIEVVSTPGQGSTFTLRLPLVDPDAAAAASSTAPDDDWI